MILDDAIASRAELIRRGRCKGSYMTGGKVCAIGAVLSALDLFDDDLTGLATNQQFVLLTGALYEELPELFQDFPRLRSKHRSIEVYNDAERTTDHDVIGLFDRVIERYSPATATTQADHELAGGENV